MHNTDTTERGHGGSHVILGDGVHGGGDAREGEIDVAREARGERNGVGREVNVVREKNDVIVSVGVALAEESIGGEAVFDRQG